MMKSIKVRSIRKEYALAETKFRIRVEVNGDAILIMVYEKLGIASGGSRYLGMVTYHV